MLTGLKGVNLGDRISTQMKRMGNLYRGIGLIEVPRIKAKKVG
jgi:hypothetical protein